MVEPRRALLLGVGASPLSSHATAKPESLFVRKPDPAGGRQALCELPRPGPLERYEPFATPVDILKQALCGYPVISGVERYGALYPLDCAGYWVVPVGICG